jgi:hypothetical protein
MKNIIFISLIGSFLLLSSCKKNNTNEVFIESWEEVDIPINGRIEASRVIDSTLVIASTDVLYKINGSHDVTEHELEIPDNWNLKESILSDELLLRFFAIDSLIYVECRPIKNLSEIYILGYDELGLSNKIIGTPNFARKTNGTFITPRKFLFAGLAYDSFREFIIELNIKLDASSEVIESVEVGELIIVPIEEELANQGVTVSNLQTLDEIAFLSTGVISGTFIYKDEELKYENDLHLSTFYKEKENWYSIQFWETNNIRKSEDKGMTWVTTEKTTRATKFRKFGDQTIGLNDGNRIIMLGESIENLNEYNLELNDDRNTFDLIEYFNGKIYLGYYLYPEDKVKFLRKDKL